MFRTHSVGEYDPTNSQTHSVGEYDPAQAKTTQQPAIGDRKSKHGTRWTCIIFLHRRGSKHPLQRHKLSTIDTEQENDLSGAPGEEAGGEGGYFRGEGERERKGIERKSFSASHPVASLLTFLSTQESKASRQGGTVIQSQQGNRIPTQQSN